MEQTPAQTQPVPVAGDQQTGEITAAPQPETTPSAATSEQPIAKPNKLRVLYVIGAGILIFLAGIGFEKFHIFSLIMRIPFPRVTITMPTPTPTPKPAHSPTPTPTMATPTATPSASLYVCPPTGYVDCMPVLSPDKQASCSAEAIDWYKANCPGFKGAAL